MTVRDGDLYAARGCGAPFLRVTHSGRVRGVAMSRDGRYAYVEGDGPTPNGDPASRSWLIVGKPGVAARRTVLRSRFSAEPARNLTGLDHPMWSLDGGYVYVNTDAWATSPALHQVNVRTGAVRFVIDGAGLRLLLDGRYRGMLLVQRHKHHPSPGYGSYDPVDLVRPDGKVILTVPQSDTDEGDASVPRWLRDHRWIASG